MWHMPSGLRLIYNGSFFFLTKYIMVVMKGLKCVTKSLPKKKKKSVTKKKIGKFNNFLYIKINK
jgi:hypothetical protein